jgi:hypothetical protein
MKKDKQDKNKISISDKGLVEYYGQIWENVKHMKLYLNQLREKYILENN